MRNPWALEYARTRDRYIWGKSPSGFARELVGLIPAGGRVLDLGCGEGRDSVYFASCGFDVTALDLSNEGLKKAERPRLFRRLKVLTKAGGLHAHIVFTNVSIYLEKGEEIDYFSRGDLGRLYGDWSILTDEEGHIVCAQDGTRHSHSIERLIASRPARTSPAPLLSA